MVKSQSPNLAKISKEFSIKDGNAFVKVKPPKNINYFSCLRFKRCLINPHVSSSFSGVNKSAISNECSRTLVLQYLFLDIHWHENIYTCLLSQISSLKSSCMQIIFTLVITQTFFVQEKKEQRLFQEFLKYV